MVQRLSVTTKLESGIGGSALSLAWTSPAGLDDPRASRQSRPGGRDGVLEVSGRLAPCPPMS